MYIENRALHSIEVWAQTENVKLIIEFLEENKYLTKTRLTLSLLLMTLTKVRSFIEYF